MQKFAKLQFCNMANVHKKTFYFMNNENYSV